MVAGSVVVVVGAVECVVGIVGGKVDSVFY